MKRLLLCALLGSLSLTVTAQTESDPSVFVRGNQIQLPDKPYLMFRGDVSRYQGSYDLASGEPMALRQVGGQLFVTVGDDERRRLVAAAPNVYVSTDSQIKLMINERDGEIVGRMWRARPDLAVNKNVPRHRQLVQLVGFR